MSCKIKAIHHHKNRQGYSIQGILSSYKFNKEAQLILLFIEVLFDFLLYNNTLFTLNMICAHLILVTSQTIFSSNIMIQNFLNFQTPCY